MVEFSVPEIMYAVYNYLYFYYLYSSLHDYRDYIQLVDYYIPRFWSNAWHTEGTQLLINESVNEKRGFYIDNEELALYF